MSWFVGDLPPRGRSVLEEEFVVLADEDLRDHLVAASNHVPMATEVQADWRVTARGIDHVFRGELLVGCRQDPGVVMVWGRPDDSETGIA